MPSSLELEYGAIDDDQNVPEVQAEDCSIDAVPKGSTQMSVSTLKGGNSQAQEHGPRQDRAQAEVQEERLTEEAHEPEAQERGQEQERRHEHQTQENEQEDRAHGNGAYKDGAYKDAAHNDMVQGGRQADEAQEVLQEDKAHGEGHNGGVNEDDVREYRQRKRRVMTKESDDGAALRA